MKKEGYTDTGDTGRSRGISAAVIVFATLALGFAVGGTIIYVLAAAHGHGIASTDGRALVAAAIGSIASALAAVWSYRQ